MIMTFHATAVHATKRSAAGNSQPQPHSQTLAPQHRQHRNHPLAPQWAPQLQLQHRPPCCRSTMPSRQQTLGMLPTTRLKTVLC